MADIKKNFVSPDFKTTLECPQCQKSRRVDVAKFIAIEKEAKLKCKCSCGHQFSVILERRRSVRKQVTFPGWMFYKRNKYKILIKDISRHGVKIFVLGKAYLKTDVKISVEFIIDDPMKSTIKRDLRIKKILNLTDVGCEFLTYDHTGNLGKYFMFYF